MREVELTRLGGPMSKEILNDYQFNKLGGFEGKGRYLTWKDDREIFNTYTLFLGQIADLVYSNRSTNILHNYDHYAQQLYDAKVPSWWTIT